MSLTHNYITVPAAGFPGSFFWYSVPPVSPTKLVVFVHGFGGRAVESWGDFPSSGEQRSWWKDADLLFLGHPSVKIDPLATSFRLAALLEEIYPKLDPRALQIGEVAGRELSSYQELYLVGHSLGGVIARRAILLIADDWIASDSHTVPSVLADVRMRLFAPATSGFDPAGNMRSAMDFVPLLGHGLQRSRSYQMLTDQKSELLHGTEMLHNRFRNLRPQLSSDRVSILWADDDDVVSFKELDGDRGRYTRRLRLSHRKICKPHRDFDEPLDFVEDGAGKQQRPRGASNESRPTYQRPLEP